MMEGVTRRMMMLRPMQAGLSGYARLQEEAGWQLVQINLRGLQGGGMRAFWYAGEGLVRELGRSAANARGEAALSAELPVDPAAPGRLTALLIADDSDKPRPLAIGLCAAQSAGSLMDAKNALLALCDRLGRMAEEERAAKAATRAETKTDGGKPNPADAGETGLDAAGSRKTTGSGKAAQTENRVQAATLPESPPQAPRLPESRQTAGGRPAQPAASRRKRSPSYTHAEEPPREVFLPAIEVRRPPRRRKARQEDSLQGAGDTVAATSRNSGMAAVQTANDTLGIQPAADRGDRPTAVDRAGASPAAETATLPGLQAGKASAPPADLLQPLYWPAPFGSLADYFRRYPPVGLMNWPGWRFVHVQEGGAGMWIGYRQQDGQVRQVAYALPAEAGPPRGGAFRPACSAQGDPIQLLVLECGEQIFPSAGIRPSGSEIV